MNIFNAWKIQGYLHQKQSSAFKRQTSSHKYVFLQAALLPVEQQSCKKRAACHVRRLDMVAGKDGQPKARKLVA